MKAKHAKIWDKSAIDLNVLHGKTIAITGYGSQGRAQALNLRDSGFTPLVGLKSKSRSRRVAKDDGFEIATPLNALRKADIVAILVPDHKHQELFSSDFIAAIKPGQTFVFAHALSVHFKLIVQPADVDFILAAPHSPGIGLREKYAGGEGVTAFIGKTDISSGESLKLAAAYAFAIGCHAGLVETSFADEAVGDIFGEQAVLCGGLSALLKAGYDTLVKAGIPRENAYLECVYQIDLIVDLIKKFGINGMYDRISETAAFGGMDVEPKIINAESRKEMTHILRDIESGKFTTGLMSDYSKGFRKFESLKKRGDNLDIDATLRKLKDKLDL